jgi:hypothetical protein
LRCGDDVTVRNQLGVRHGPGPTTRESDSLRKSHGHCRSPIKKALQTDSRFEGLHPVFFALASGLIFVCLAKIRKYGRAGLLASGSSYSLCLPISLGDKTVAFCRFRPRLQRRDRSRFQRDSLLCRFGTRCGLVIRECFFCQGVLFFFKPLLRRM